MRLTGGIAVKLIGLILLFLNLTGSTGLYGAETDDLYVFNESKIRIEGVLKPFEASVNIQDQGLQRYIVSIYLHSPYAAKPPHFNFSVKFPKSKIDQIWSSRTWSNKSFFTIPSYDRAAVDFSIISGMTINDQNQITFSGKDAYNARFITSNIEEANDTVVFKLSFFDENPPLSNLQDYEAKVMVDFRNIHFSKAIYNAATWFLSDLFKNEAAHLDTLNVPVFSTWYPMHRNIPLEDITRELDSLRTFNFRSILVDDGWQALVKMKVDTAYKYEESSFQTMSLFKKKCDNMKLPLYLWYSLPFIGGNPVVMKKFEGEYIRYRAPRQMYVLDPRYSDVRSYLVSTYANFLKTWQFDGYWLDFLKGFYPKDGAVIEEDKGRDYVSIDLAVDTLYKEMESRLKAIRPDIFLGQKLQIAGPNLLSYQNFLTGFVGVNNIQVVREKMVNNRLLYGKYTPFMEIVGITDRDSAEDIALKIQSVFLDNLYLSFYITTLPETSKRTIRFWLNYWKENYKVIFDGDFEPLSVSQFYPAVKVDNDLKSIYMIYETYPVNLPLSLSSTIDIVNSKKTTDLQFLFSKPGLRYGYEIFNCYGKSLEKGEIKTRNKNLFTMNVPAAGFIRITPAHD